jgi:sulfate/thiosulfate transport system permease protein
MSGPTTTTNPTALPAGRHRRAVARPDGATALTTGITVLWLSGIVLLPLSAVVFKATDQSVESFWAALSNPVAVAALQFTLLAAVCVGLIAAVMGTLIAWVLVRDEFRGKRLMNMVIDLPFALPTIVAGLTLLALYGPKSSLVDLSFSRAGVIAALLFVTLPFVVRSTQPVLIELDREMEEAAASLGAGNVTIFRRVILPNLGPAILTGTALSFAKAIGEFGSVALISGNIPFETEVASVYIFSQIESDNPAGAAAVSTVLLAISLVVLALIAIVQRRLGRGQ